MDVAVSGSHKNTQSEIKGLDELIPNRTSNRVFKKVRNIVINKLLWYVKWKGKFRWKKWSMNELFDKYKLYNDYRIRYYQKA